MAIQKRKANKSSKFVSTRGKKWVVAVDPFGDIDLQTELNLVKTMAEKEGAQLEAVYVLAPSALNWTGDFSGPWMKKYMPLSQAKLNQALPDPEIKKTVVACKEAGLRSSVQALDRHARKVKASCLVISTHARKGLERMALGSFAESVILASKTPVLIMNPNRKLPSSVRKILVPTDLSRKSEKFLDAVAAHAKRLNAEVVLYHKQADPLDPIIQQGVYALGGGWVSVESFLDQEVASKNKQIARIEEKLRKRNIAVSHVFDSSPGGLIDSIERATKESGADMVSVLTQSGKWSALILGSVARSLARTSPVPVLVNH